MYTYKLMNKDDVLLIFKESSFPGEYDILEVNEPLKSTLPPIFTSEIDSRRLRTFIENRVVSINRTHIDIVLGKINTKTKFEQVIYCKGLSLSDTYWILPEYEYFTWKEVNLFTNKFDKALGWMAFTGVPSDVSRHLRTPELTTVGVLPKYWDRDKSKVFLVKGGTRHYANAGLEPISEVCASVIAEVLGLNAIRYDYAIVENRPVSICKLFTSEDIGLLTAQEFRFLAGIDNISVSLKDYMEIMQNFGLETKELKRMIFFDDLVRNSDRHLNNWGFSVCNNTRRLLGLAPIWDTGESLIAKTMPDDFPLMAASEEEFASFNTLYRLLRPIYYREQEKSDLYKLETLIKSSRLMTLFKERNIPDSENDKLNLICEVLIARINMIRDDI